MILHQWIGPFGEAYGLNHGFRFWPQIFSVEVMAGRRKLQEEIEGIPCKSALLACRFPLLLLRSACKQTLGRIRAMVPETCLVYKSRHL